MKCLDFVPLSFVERTRRFFSTISNLIGKQTRAVCVVINYKLKKQSKGRENESQTAVEVRECTCPTPRMHAL